MAEQMGLHVHVHDSCRPYPPTSKEDSETFSSRNSQMPTDAAEERATDPSVITTIPPRILRRKKKRNLSLSHSADFQFPHPSKSKRPRTALHSAETASEKHYSAKGKERAHMPPGGLVGPKVNGGIHEASGSLVVPYRASSPGDSVTSSHRTDEVIESQGPSQEILEIQRLQKELSLKNEIIQKQQSTLQSLQNLLQCQICLELLWKPFLLSPCGHVLCESCLKSWFTSPHPAAPVLLAPQHREKTCPCCRTTIRARPIAIYLVKSAVSSLAPSLDPSTFSRPSLVDEPKPDAGDRSNNPSQDPWEGIFPAPRGIHALADHPGLIVDEQDGGVLRCAECLHEIFDGLCTGCGRTYEDAVAEAASDVEAFRLYPFASESDDEDHESAVSFEEVYEDSFIDDGEEEDEGGDPRSAADESGHGEIDIDEAADPEAFYDAHNGYSSDRSSLPRIIIHRQTRRVAGPQDNIEGDEVFHDAQSTILDDEPGGASRSTPAEAQQSRSHGQVSSRHLRPARAPRVSSPVIMLDADSDDEEAFYQGRTNSYHPASEGYVLRLPPPRIHLDELGRVVFDSTDDEADDDAREADLRRDRNSFSTRRGLSSSRRTEASRRARVIRSISPSVNGSESEQGLAHRVAGFERDIYGEDDFVAQRPRPTHDDDEEVDDGLSSLEEASSGHSHSDGFLSDSDDHEHHDPIDAEESSDRDDIEEGDDEH